MHRRLITLSLVAITLAATAVTAEESCFYIDSKGVFVTTNSEADIPAGYKGAAKCSEVRKRSTRTAVNPSPGANHRVQFVRPNRPARPATNVRTYNGQQILRPDEVSLGRGQRQKDVNTALGTVRFSWEPSVEKYFGKSAERTIISSMNAAARVLAQKSFPREVREGVYDWRIVIMDGVPKEADVNINGKASCHPGWMRPPADIFLAAERIATRCGTGRMTEEATRIQLEETLVHEIGHAVEYKFLGRRYRQHERWHKEGFATWFESLAANYISARGLNRAIMRNRVKRHWQDNWNPSAFAGSSKDYSRGYAMIATIAEKRTVSRLKEIYQLAAQRNIPLLKAVEEGLHWDRKTYFKNVASNYELN